MSLGRTTCVPICRRIDQKASLVRADRLIRPSIASVCLSQNVRRVAPTIWIRSKKTSSTVRLSDLPQGVLPPLPTVEGNDEVERRYSPVLQQHLENVKKYRDCIVLTRIGDFYEMYFNQVEEYAPLVGLKKAKRPSAFGDIPMAGFQHTALEKYLKMFVLDLGKAVAISEQVPLSSSAKTSRVGGPMFDRKVSRVVTAGTLIDESFLNAFENNYLLSIDFGKATAAVQESANNDKNRDLWQRTVGIGLSWVDLSNGDFFTQASDLSLLPSQIARISPREIVLSPLLETLDHSDLQKLLGQGSYSVHHHERSDPTNSIDSWTAMLEEAVPDEDRQHFTPLEIGAGSLVLDYVRDKLLDTHIHLRAPIRRSEDEYMTIDKHSLRGLEIRTTLRDGLFQGSLLHSLRRTVTNSGARLLSQRLVSPSLSLSVINQRLGLVESLVNQDALREDITALLKRTSDTLRLVQRFSIGRGDADDLLGLAKTIDVMNEISKLLRHASLADKPPYESLDPVEFDNLRQLANRFDLGGPSKVAKSIYASIDEEGLSLQHSVDDEARARAEEMSAEVEDADAAGEKAPRLVRRATASKSSANAGDLTDDDIWIMQKQASPVLERAHDDLLALLQAKQDLTMRLRAELKAQSLTLKWSGGLGHHCHVKGRDMKRSLASLDGARETGSSRSTRTFYYTGWTQLGSQIEAVKLRIRHEEERVFRKLRAQIIENLMKLRRNAAILDELDVACSSATVAKERNLIKPIVTARPSHKIFSGRHPTVDMGLQEQGRPFTANDCLVGDSERIYLITGPNMAGKSTYLRQNALITILAQTGCFVPASYAEIGLVDKIFSRVGSADNLYADQSTFMVEMLETAAILKNATPRSFVIMDEVGRGTTPSDGLAVAYACLHHLYYENKCRTLFATHFHDLARLTAGFEKLACFCTDVAEEPDGSWAYLHRLQRGVNWHSHAFKVAEMAGLPRSAIRVAEEVVANMQRRDEGEVGMKDTSFPAVSTASS